MSVEPLYAQIADELRANILSGRWKPGDRIPPELDLCEQYHVSRITVRKGIEQLVDERLVRRERAKGTFVNDWAASSRSDHFTLVKGFAEEMRELGKTAQTVWAHVSVELADARTARLLGRPEGSPLLVLRRTRGTDGGKPFVYFVTYLTWRDDYPLDSEAYYGSLYALLRERGVIINQDREYVEAVKPSQEVQQILEIDRNQPVLKRTIMRRAPGDFREHTECFYIGSEYKFHFVGM